MGYSWDFNLYSDRNPYDPSVKLSTHDQTKIAQQYVDLVRYIAQTYIDLGFYISHIPFALEDDLFAKSCLSDLPIKFYKFTNNPYQVFDNLQSLEGFIPTRLHAHIFSAIARIPFFSISYGAKTKNILRLLQVPRSSSVDYNLLLEIHNFSQDLELPKPPNFVCKEKHLLSLSTESKVAIEKCLLRLANAD
ncbi:hypothetical protein AWQ22_07780 [Picosynechococcus sp. PCC 7117]|nr:hypothetical protein AWQ22_07780 [Picosynechococcus sp. PCC 7117]